MTKEEELRVAILDVTKEFTQDRVRRLIDSNSKYIGKILQDVDDSLYNDTKQWSL